MRKIYKVIVGLASTVSVCAVALAVASASGLSLTGLLAKAYDKTLSPGEQYQRNITVRKYYNMSVRFQKGSSTSYLTFSDNGSVIVFRDASGGEVARLYGVKSGHSYLLVTKDQLDAIRTVSAFNVSTYADIVDETVDESSVSYSGTTAYVNVKVSYGPATMSGYVFDDLTGQPVQGAAVSAFGDGADVNVTAAIAGNLTDSNGRYSMSFNLTDDSAFDVYVGGYDVV